MADTHTVTTAEDVRSLEAGLDALEAKVVVRTSPWVRIRRSVIPPLVTVLIFLAVWEILYRLEIKPPYALPSPADTWLTLQDLFASGFAQDALLGSLQHAFVGYSAAVVIGTALGVLMARVRVVRAGLGPFVSGLQVLPSVAWVPAAIIWFGLTDAAIYAVVLLGAVPSIANGLLAGIDQVPPLYVRVGHVLGARGLTAVRRVILPAAFPGYLAGLKQGWAFSWRSLMAAELIAASPEIGPGLGFLLDQGRQLSDMAWVFGGILLILAVGIAVELLFFAPLERRVLRQRGLTGAKL